MSSTLRIHAPMPTGIHIEQYSGPWAIEEQAANMLIQSANGLQLSQHIKANSEAVAAASRNFGYETVPHSSGGSVAIVGVSGVMTKYGSSLSDNGSTIRARKALANAVRDASVKSIVMLFETPGGTVAGTKELADDIADAASKKTVWSYCNDLCASAGYWAASHASKVYANQMAMVGSIGTYAVISDFSKMFSDSGVKVHVVRAGEFKGMGAMGTKVTDKQLTYLQEIIDAHNQEFLNGVQRHRGLSAAQMKLVVDGRVHVAASALRLGLIDGIQSFEQTLEQLSGKQSQATAKAPSAVQQWDAAIHDKMESENISKHAAVRQLVKQNPDLHQRYLQEFNRR